MGSIIELKGKRDWECGSWYIKPTIDGVFWEFQKSLKVFEPLLRSIIMELRTKNGEELRLGIQ